MKKIKHMDKLRNIYHSSKVECLIDPDRIMGFMGELYAYPDVALHKAQIDNKGFDTPVPHFVGKDRNLSLIVGQLWQVGKSHNETDISTTVLAELEVEPRERYCFSIYERTNLLIPSKDLYELVEKYQCPVRRTGLGYS